MKNYKKFYLLFFLLVLGSYAFAQQYPPRISGVVFDGDSNKPLPGAVVVVKTLTDSVVASVSTNGEGVFEIRKRIQTGDFKVLFSFMGYETLEQKITLVPRQPLKMENIKLKTKDQSLKEIVISDNVGMVKVNSDTTEFNSSAYKTDKNAAAEDLVKKMPGMEIDDQGKVKSHGQEVQRILVDGKPFFGDDPSMALKNLPAEVVEKVQMVDQMNEQAQFTGFDDNERVKTMNIVTKKEKRKGYFGKFNAGYGTDDRYSVGGNANLFDGDRRLSVVGMLNNNNEMNFSMMDMFGSEGGGGQRGMGMGRMMRSGGGGFSSNGLNKVASVGLNYSDVWASKIKFTASYFLNNTTNNNDQFSNRETFTSKTTSQFSNTNNLSESKNLNHRFNMRMDYYIDSMNYLMLRPILNIQDNSQKYNRIYNGFGTDALQVNKSVQDYSSQSDGISFSNELQYNHRFNKTRRTFSVNANFSTNPKTSDTYLDAENTYFIDKMFTFNKQYTTSENKGYAISSSFAYTEPISSNGIAQVSYFVSYSKSNSDRITNKYREITQQYDNLAPELSNTFDNGYKTQRGGLSYMHKINTAILTVGGNYQESSLDNSQIYPETLSLNRNFTNILPYASLTWKNGKKASLNINYTSSTRPPDISQLQNVFNIDDPVRISSGNPELKQEYSNSLTTRFSFVHPESTRTIMLVLSGNYVTDRIANSTIIADQDMIIDAAKKIALKSGGQYTKPVNVNDPYWNLRSFITLGTPILKKKININLNSGISFTNDPGLINGNTNISKTYSFNEGLVISSNISESIDFTLSGFLSYNVVKYSMLTNLNSNYNSQRYNFRFNYILSGFTFSSNVSYIVNKGMGQDYNIEYTLWNASFGRQFLKNKNAEIKLSVFDILKQNSSVSRNVTQSYVEDVRNQTIGQYFMLSFIYNLRSFGGGMPDNMKNPNRREHMH